MNKKLKTILVVCLIAICLFALGKFVLYKIREKSCRDFSTANLELDDKYPLPGQNKATSGYNNVGQYKQMYDDCMFLQGY